jgi:hypothetical protein
MARSPGRPPLPPSQRKVRIQVMVRPAQVAWAEALGKGNLSDGVCKGLALAMQLNAPELVAANIAQIALERAEMSKSRKPRYYAEQSCELSAEERELYKALDEAPQEDADADEPAPPAGALDGTAATDFD